MNRTDLKKVLEYLEEGNIERAKGFLTVKLEQVEAKSIKLGKLMELKLCSSEPLTVKAFPVGKYFAVHKKGGSWTVTHVPSGLAACGGISRKGLAILYAKAFSEVPVSWENKEPLRGLDSITMTALTELSGAARANKTLSPKTIA